MSTFSKLPLEIFSLILTHLEQGDLYECALVNAQWQAPANRLLWRSVQICHQAPSVQFPYCLAQTGGHSVGQWIRHVNLQDFCWTDTTLLVLMRGAPHVTSLVLDNAILVTDASMQHIGYYCPSIQLLHIGLSSISGSSYCALGQQLPRLSHLELWNCPGLESDTFSRYFVDSPLRSLMLATWANDITIDLTRLRQMTHLQLHGPPYEMIHQAIRTDMPWPHLTSLDLEACFGMVDIDVVALLLTVPPLTHLALRDGNFTNAALFTIAAYQPTLQVLDISFCDQFTPRGIRYLVCQCTQLSLLQLSYCGFEMDTFPEASLLCQGTVETFENTLTALDHLDQTAMDTIRRQSDLDEGFDSDWEGV